MRRGITFDKSHKNEKSKSKSKSKRKRKSINRRKNEKNEKKEKSKRHRQPQNTIFKKMNCSPIGHTRKAGKYTCMSRDSISEVRSLWNKSHPHKTIEAVHGSKGGANEWHSLRKNMSGVCKTEKCWLRQNFMNGRMDTIARDSYAPSAPRSWSKNKNEWLSDEDITKVMHQYEAAYPCFKFIGPSPIDFDANDTENKDSSNKCVWNDLCKFDLDSLIKSGKTKLGIILNTDTHDKNGMHWISMFINIRKGTIFFFDSVGDTAPPEVHALVKRIVAQGAAMQPPRHFIYDENHPVEHQYGETECGIYSLFFIAHMLEDKITQNYMKTHVLRDKYMEKFRHVYFNK